MADATAIVKKHCAKQFKVKPDDVTVRLVTVPPVPNIAVFAADIDPDKLGRDASVFGIVDDGDVYTEVEAIERVVRAWGYGATRTVSAADFAYVIAMISSSRHATSAIIDGAMLATYKSISAPDVAAAADLPKEAIVDGKPAVIYSQTGGRAPFTIVTAIVAPDGSVELRRQPITS